MIPCAPTSAPSAAPQTQKPTEIPTQPTIAFSPTFTPSLSVAGSSFANIASFSYNGSVVQSWTVPDTGQYTIVAAGAQGRTSLGMLIYIFI